MCFFMVSLRHFGSASGLTVPRVGIMRRDIHDGVQFVHVVGVQKDAIFDDLGHHHLKPTSQSSCDFIMDHNGYYSTSPQYLPVKKSLQCEKLNHVKTRNTKNGVIRNHKWGDLLTYDWCRALTVS